MGRRLGDGGRRRGGILIDAAVGLAVVTTTVAGLAAVSTAAEQAVTATATSTERAAWARTEAATLSRDPSQVPAGTPVGADTTIGAGTVPVFRWREDLTGIAKINVSVPTGDSADCADPDIRATACFTATVSVTTADPGIITTPVDAEFAPAEVALGAGAAVASTTLTSFTVPDVGEVRYVVRVDAATGVGEVRFVSGGRVLEAILFDESDDTYFYGSVFATPDDTVDVEVVGASVHLSRFTLYEAAR
ncbi:hypothetical protein [Agromyces humi]|uniref:hypothetical protein n=1 Tax=Agromyces humi TaxID=1766800 RepID=UPI00135A2CB5|nr:hypothetical protein [Agromyces humi]